MFFTLGSFKNCSLKGSLGNPKCVLNGIAMKTPFFEPLFLREKGR